LPIHQQQSAQAHLVTHVAAIPTKLIVLLVTPTAAAHGLQVIHAAPSTAIKVAAKVKLGVLTKLLVVLTLATKRLAKHKPAVLGLTRRKTVLAWMKQRAVLLAAVLKIMTTAPTTLTVVETAQRVTQLTAVVSVPMIVGLELVPEALGTLAVPELTTIIVAQEAHITQATAQALTARHAAERQLVAASMIQQIATPSLDALGKPLLL
jgi:hypothetical protein